MATLRGERERIKGEGIKGGTAARARRSAVRHCNLANVVLQDAESHVTSKEGKGFSTADVKDCRVCIANSSAIEKMGNVTAMAVLRNAREAEARSRSISVAKA